MSAGFYVVILIVLLAGVSLLGKFLNEGMNKGILETLVGLVKDGFISLAEAAKRANMTVSEFEDKTGLKHKNRAVA